MEETCPLYNSAIANCGSGAAAVCWVCMRCVHIDSLSVGVDITPPNPIGTATEGISHPLYMYVQAVRALASMQEPPSLHFPATAAYAPYRCLYTVAAGMHLR